MADDFSPIYQGDTGAPFHPKFQRLDGTAFDLTDATITLKMQNEAGTIQIGAGTWTITDASLGKASYAYGTADVATPGAWLLSIKIVIGGKPVHADEKILEILPVI